MKILVTGFEPFGDNPVNASWQAVKCLPDKIDGAEIIGLQVPVEYGRAGLTVLDAARKVNPALILSVGLAAGRRCITPELVAVNWRMATIADNAGMQYSGVRIDSAAPAARMTGLPVMAMVDAVRQLDIPCNLSLSAGAYVCNDLYWSLLEHTEEGGCPTLFVHVPGDNEINIEDTAKALEVILKVALEAIKG